MDRGLEYALFDAISGVINYVGVKVLNFRLHTLLLHVGAQAFQKLEGT